MFCFRVKRKLYDLVSGELSGKESTGIIAHLKKCPSCRNEQQRLERFLGLVSHQPEPQLKEGFWREFQAELDRKLAERQQQPGFRVSLPRFQPRLNWQPAFAFALVLILFVGLTSLLLQRAPLLLQEARLSKIDSGILDEIIFYEELGEPSVFALLNGADTIEEDIQLLRALNLSL